MKIAIYARQSRYSDKGESIENQVEACKNYAEKVYNEQIDYTVYIDEGFSGKNTDRPEYKRMMYDAKNKAFNVLMSYKLDRISRSVSDFTKTYEELEKYGIQFVSIKEQFDTSTPMGRVMLNISVVFAQFERETIAERIRDNMYANARKGNWTGGTSPLGYRQVRTSYTNEQGRSKKITVLEQNPDETDLLKLVYKKYVEIKSLNALVTYLINNNIKTSNNFNFSTSTLYEILINPTFVIADLRLYEYLVKRGYDVCSPKELFTGEYGIMPYNRHDKKRNRINKREDWIIAIGSHKGTINSDEWIEVQNILDSNANKHPRVQTGELGMFSGLIRCKNCGSMMRVKKGNVSKKSNEQKFVYICYLKEVSKLQKCDMANVLGNEADENIVNYLLKLAEDEEAFANKLSLPIYPENNKKDKKDFEKKLADNNLRVNNLIDALSQTNNGEVKKNLLSKIEALQNENNEMYNKIKQFEIMESNTAKASEDMQVLIAAIRQLKNVSGLDIRQKRDVAKVLINKIIWNGKEFEICLNEPRQINF